MQPVFNGMEISQNKISFLIYRDAQSFVYYFTFFLSRKICNIWERSDGANITEFWHEISTKKNMILKL